MSRIVLVHWNSADAEEKAGRLRGAGHDVACFPGRGVADPRRIFEDPPDLFVIDLSRSPSQGRDAGLYFRSRKATRSVPLLFVEGDPEKTGRVRDLIPDAVYGSWGRILGGIRQAIRDAPRKPVSPGALSGYAGTPLLKKLGIGPGRTAALIGAPAGFERTLGELPEGARARRGARGLSEVVLLFVRSGADLGERFAGAVRAMAAGGRIWIIWPKKASGGAGDLTQSRVRAFGLARGLVDYKICSVDATWSGLCFARREASRTPARGRPGSP